MKIHSEQEMLNFGEKFKPTTNVIELIGDVGTGKTTFVRGLAKGLGIKEPITSPSFTISKIYALPDGGNLVHYDFYRLDEPGLMLNDFTEFANDSNNLIVIEWAKTINDFLPENRNKIFIHRNDDDSREVEIS